MHEITYSFEGYQIGRLEGKVLTLIEASIQDLEQRKALKDIMRQTIWGWAIDENQENKINKAGSVNGKK